MEKYAQSSDGQNIHYKESGEGNPSILFVHGWLGNAEWWNSQQEYFKDQYHIVQMSLAGHGKSDTSRKTWSSESYSDDIKAVADQLDSKEIILVGHSMSGAYVLEAALKIPQVKALILIDTVKDLDETFTDEQAEDYLFVHYRNDFKNAVENILPQYLFSEKTPPEVKEKLQNEFLHNTSETAIELLRPLYKTDFRETASNVQVPVRAINSDNSPTNADNNRKYLKDYEYVEIAGTGHYPMLENPEKFNQLLEQTIKELI
ncbi:alpha/beta hydrolase [Chryseobacterium carnipullorum]|uniref:Alpha/beta hydrolase n=1 Tax=Chryseobacterium carnipullorum TaxID=1124835 RepID=A0A1M7BJP8_CHRCU|nr:alpha/beta hydrolase [Chryseobacterium carnipullorum]AZA48468.1 alpha/beta hydrolase [Chryseobacterium carnipullorum]AZA63396.1 alpha/beta hydrolase [Chryseobacterium carnipullorum]SHL55171.1 Pimeloyl-ACP methyl ester carboxylesterase [Chryseobacterium carnipullorum]STC92410.1 Arylesterase [Chryseobacterium carnipullorum]